MHCRRMSLESRSSGRDARTTASEDAGATFKRSSTGALISMNNKAKVANTDLRSRVPDRSAGVPPAVAGASRPRFGDVKIRHRGHLPHWEKEGATYFITFRLADSLPRSVLDRITSERESIVKTAIQLRRNLSADETKKIQKLSTRIVEQYLDNGAGACHLRRPEIANIAANALNHFDNKKYRLLAWCVMPNHVHVVVRLLPGNKLADVVHSWKSFTAKQANYVLERRGIFVAAGVLRPFDTRCAGIGASDSLCRGEPGEGWLTRLEMGLGVRAGRPHDSRRGRRRYCRRYHR